MHRYRRIRHSYGILTIAAAVLFVAGSCSQPSLYNLLNGPDGIPLQVDPVTAQVVTGEDLEVQASGGLPPYTYSLSTPIGGTGEDLIGGLYSAPTDTTGFVTITVNDSYGAETQADIEVVNSTGPGPTDNDVDYAVVSLVNTGGTIGGGTASGEFRITNAGDDDGSAPISWIAFTSDDSEIDGGDDVIDSGTVSSLNSSDTSAPISFSGTWLLSGSEKTCYLIVSISADDSPNDDAYISETITVPPVADVDYRISRMDAVPVSVPADDAISLTFDIQNDGDDPGTATVNWSAYITPYAEYRTSDTSVDSGTFAALGSGSSSTGISIDGNWSTGSGARYLHVKVDATDDVNPDNDVFSSSAVLVQSSPTDIDYVIGDISRDYPTVTVGSLIAETYDISNIGGAEGSASIDVTIYVSEDDSWDVGDTLVPDEQAILDGLDAGDSHSSVPIYGAWPNEAGTRYLIIEVASVDETIDDNNRLTAGPFTVKSPPDYSVTDTVFGGEGVPGIAFSGSGTWGFTISEVAGNNGSQPISWEVFATADGVVNDDDDPVKSGSIPALAAGTTSEVISFSDATWPDFGGKYTVIISIDAGDDGIRNNNEARSQLISVPELFSHDGDLSSGTGPVTGEISGAVDLDPDGDSDHTLNRHQYIRVTTTRQGNSEDCFEFVTGTGVTSIELWAEWVEPENLLNLYVWDEDGNEWASEDWSSPKDREPLVGVFSVPGLVEGDRYYIGVDFYGAPADDTTYDLHIYAP